VLADGTVFPHYFQLLPINNAAPVYDAISKAFDWNHIVFIVENVNLFTVVRYLLLEYFFYSHSLKGKEM